MIYKAFFAMSPRSRYAAFRTAGPGARARQRCRQHGNCWAEAIQKQDVSLWAAKQGFVTNRAEQGAADFVIRRGESGRRLEARGISMFGGADPTFLARAAR